MSDPRSPSTLGATLRALARIVVVGVPPLLLASALLAAPKNPAPPPKKPPIKWAPKAKDAGAADAADAGKTDGGPKETKFDAKPAGTSIDPNDTVIKESERKEGDASIKVFEGQSEVEGRSRWPALSYFIRRMRAEFEAQKLPHRSFLPELKASKGDPAVK